MNTEGKKGVLSFTNLANLSQAGLTSIKIHLDLFHLKSFLASISYSGLSSI